MRLRQGYLKAYSQAQMAFHVVTHRLMQLINQISSFAVISQHRVSVKRAMLRLSPSRSTDYAQVLHMTQYTYRWR